MSIVARKLLKVARKFSAHLFTTFGAHILMKVARYRQTLARKTNKVTRKT
jgi:tellurite resistance protein TehA-like permease